tara:strand:+ start:278 stop:1432 length:1155 start_codon:yes stop_codon:yes gene_type:complete
MPKLLTNSNIEDKKVLLRLDLNVPIYKNKILSDFRIIKCIPTINYLLERNNKIIILSHIGRPDEGVYDKNFSLINVNSYLEKKLKTKIPFLKNWISGVSFTDSNIVMCENVRFCKGESSNDAKLSEKISNLGDIFVFDAFGVSHRKSSSTYGISNYLETFAGPLLENEIYSANKFINSSKRPIGTIISGAKVSTKLKIIKRLLDKSDYIIIGGGILNTFLLAMDYNVGKSLIEPNYLDEARNIINDERFSKVILPVDVIVSNNSELDNPKTKLINMVQSDDKILDIGEKTIDRYSEIIAKSHSIFWNGPLGLLEKNPYDNGTKEIAKIIANSDIYSIVGGGDTIPIIEHMNLEDKFTNLSTGGGSLLKYIEGDELPILKKLEFY